jgi:outer membrane protein TolC
LRQTPAGEAFDGGGVIPQAPAHMRTRLLSGLAALVSALSAGAQPAAPAPPRVVTLAECTAMALERNLDIQIRRLQPSIDLYNLDASRGFYDLTFNLNASQRYNSSPGSADPASRLFNVSSETYSETYGPSFTQQLGTGGRLTVNADLVRRSGNQFNSFNYSTDAGISLTQPLLRNSWIDSTRQSIQISKRTLKIDELALRNQVMTTITSVQQAYYELVYARDNVRVQEASLELAQKLLADNKRRVEVGALAPLDEKQSESQVAARRSDLLAARRDLEVQMNNLKNLIGDDFAGLAGVTFEPSDKLLALPQSLSAQDSWRHGMSLRPDLLQAREQIERQNIVLRFNHNQLFPSLDLTLTYGHNGIGQTLPAGLNGIQRGDNQFYSYGIVLSFPLNNTTAKNNYKASKVQKELLLLQFKQLEQSVIVEIDNAVKQAQTAYDRIEATRQARLYAEAALEAEEKKLENGKSTSFFVLQLQRDLTAARSAEIRALADYNRALSTLSRSEGTTLEKANVSLEFK